MTRHHAPPRCQRPGRLPATVAAAAVAVLCGGLTLPTTAGCTQLITGHGKSMLYDPYHVAGLPAADGPSGPRRDAPAPSGKVENTDDGPFDKLALMAVNDIEAYWKQEYGPPLKGHFVPVGQLVSYNSKDPFGPRVCRERTYKLVNAFFAPRCNLIAWDRGVLVPTGEKFFGDMPVVGVFAHEYGHALQHMAKLVHRTTPTLVLEQQADCFGGVYMRWVAEGNSPRFTLSTGDGLDHVLAGLVDIRDPILTPDSDELVEEGHGTALDRISAFQMGFTNGASTCAEIDMDEIKKRRGDLPLELQPDPHGEVETGEVPINEETLSTLMEVLGKIFSPRKPPKLSFDPVKCADANPSPPASYCPATNTISVDLPALQSMGEPADEETAQVLIQGDDTAMSVVMSRYTLELQRERGLALNTADAALRTACLTGVAHRQMAKPVTGPSGRSMSITAGDLDEAVAGLLTNQLAGSDVDGVTVPAGFTRITAFRSGVVGNEELCYRRFS